MKILILLLVFFQSPDSLPTQIDLQPYCPAVGNQGGLPSCVGWAAGYGALTIERAIRENCTDTKIITHNASSALFIYNSLRQDCGQGIRIDEAMDFLQNTGDCLYRHFDTQLDNCEKNPPEALVEAACNFAVIDWQQLFKAHEPDTLKVRLVREALAQGKPVVAGLSVRRNFFNLKKGHYWWPELGDTAPAGGHAMVVVGYDDKKQAFRLMNSWGKNWGDGGFIWIKYKVFGRFCKHGHIVRLGEKQVEPVQRTGFQPKAG